MLYVVWQNIRQVEPFEKRGFKPRSIWDQHGSSPYSQPVHNGPSIVVYFLIEMPGLLFANFKPVCLPLAFWTMQPFNSKYSRSKVQQKIPFPLARLRLSFFPSSYVHPLNPSTWSERVWYARARSVFAHRVLFIRVGGKREENKDWKRRFFFSCLLQYLVFFLTSPPKKWVGLQTSTRPLKA